VEAVVADRVLAAGHGGLKERRSGMLELPALDGMDGFWSLEMDGDVAIILLGDDIIELATDLARLQAWLELLGAAGKLSDCRAILLLPNEVCLSPARCEDFWQKLLSDLKTARGRETQKRSWITREENFFHRQARAVRLISKPVLVGLRGDVALPFLGMALACDCRIAAEDTVFHNRCRQVHRPALGGLSCLLPHYVGFGKTAEIMLMRDQVDCSEAFSLGLINEMVPVGQFERQAVEIAHRWAELPTQLVETVKRQINIHLRDLDEHFEAEMKEAERIMQQFHAGGAPIRHS
jgi:hypothetical protein